MLRPEEPLATMVGNLARGARTAIGWTQRQLAERAGVPQSLISRLERGLHSGADLDDLERIAKAMGGAFRVQLHAPFLEDRRRQRDRVHSTCIAYVTRRLQRSGWLTASEVEIGGTAGPGWIDVLAFHPASGALLVIEIKTEIHDFGRIQRTLSWYESRAWSAARRLGWSVRHAHPVLLLLDSAAVADGLRANRPLAAQEYVGRAPDLAAFIARPTRAPRPGRSVAVIDPLSRRASWLAATPLDGRRTATAYRDYAELARRLR